MEKVKIDKEEADKLLKHSIDGRRLATLTGEKLDRVGLVVGAGEQLLDSIALLWKNITIHGVILAPADEEENSESCTTVDGSSILTLRGMDARKYLGGLDQLFRYMT